MKKIYKSSEETKAPLSGACEINGLVFLSGQIHMQNGQLVGETIEEKFNVVITNIEKLLADARLTLEDVIRVHLYLTDLSELATLNRVYVERFKNPLPARTAVEVSALPLGANLEMDVIAVRT